MKLNKILCVMIALFAINTAAYAIEVSIGTSFGAGLPIFRGTNAKDRIEEIGKGDGIKKKTFAFALPQVNLMIEFIPSLALETGLGFRYSTLKYNDGFEGNTFKLEINNSFTRSEIYIPIMLRGQFEYNLGVTYLSAGVKLGIPISDYSVTELKFADFPALDEETKIKASQFTLDIAFALGQEFRIATSHYVGIRLCYDLNVIRPYATSPKNDYKKDTMLDDTDWFQDDFIVALTYRYAFNSKWK